MIVKIHTKIDDFNIQKLSISEQEIETLLEVDTLLRCISTDEITGVNLSTEELQYIQDCIL